MTTVAQHQEQADRALAVAHHQAQADRFLAFAASNAQAGEYALSVHALARATTHAATAANLHWTMFRNPHQRQLGHVLLILASQRHLSYTSARFIHKFDTLNRTIDRARCAGDRPAVRRMLRNARRRVARIIAAINRAIAADPNPRPYWKTPEEVLAEYPEP